MRKLLILALLVPVTLWGQSVSVGGTVNSGGTYNIGMFTVTPPTAACSGYALDIPVTLTKAVGSDQTNGLVRVWGRDYRLASVANGGNVQNSTTNALGRTVPADLIFATTTAATTALKHETVLWDAITGDFEFWVQQPTLHTASNDTIHLCANNASVSTSQDDLSLWADASYVGVWHFPHGTVYTSPDLKNSVTGTSATPIATVTQNYGSTGDGVWLGDTGNTTSVNWVQVADTASFRPSTVTLEASGFLINTHTNALIGHPSSTVTTCGGPSFGCYGYALNVVGNGVGTGFPVVVSPTINIGGTASGVTGTTAISRGNFFDIGATFNGTTLKGFMNGAMDASTALSGSIFYSGSADLGLGTASPYVSFPSFDMWNGLLDEAWIASGAKTDNWMATESQNRNAYATSSEFADTSFAKPKVIQQQGCNAGTPANASCVMPFNVTSGVMVAMVVYHSSATPICPAAGVTDTKGFTYTNQASSYFIGSLEYYVVCLYTAPITSSGADTVTISSDSRDVAAELYEIRNATVSGATFADASTHNQPFTMTATSPSSNAILLCATSSNWQSTPSSSPGTVSPSSYRLEISPATIPQADPHLDFLQIGWGLVGSGSQSCSFGGGYVGRGGVMGILAYAP